MGHRRHSAPRRGSLAYLPRSRAKSFEARIRAWPKVNSEEPKLLMHAGFKAGCVQIVNIDDREKTPNYGKQLVSLGTVIVTPPIIVVGIRGYSKDLNGKHARFDLYANDLPKNVSQLFKSKNKYELLEYSEKAFKKIKEIYALIAVIPRNAGLELCTGGIIGLGETRKQREELIFEIVGFEPEEVTINMLVPMPGTPLELQTQLDITEILRVFSTLRFLLPESIIKISGGREVNLKDDGQKLLLSGANGIISAGYLTMDGNTVKKDTKMINEINLETQV